MNPLLKEIRHNPLLWLRIESANRLAEVE